MARVTLDTLQALNAGLLGQRWTDEDLDRLITPRFGLVSSFESVLSDLAEILKKDLGDTSPCAPAAEPQA
jgi:hypothetical protein